MRTDQLIIYLHLDHVEWHEHMTRVTFTISKYKLPLPSIHIRISASSLFLVERLESKATVDQCHPSHRKKCT